MKCDEAQTWLDAWLDDELPDRRRSRIEAHLRDCARCRQARREAEEIRSQLRRMPVPMPSEWEWHERTAALVSAVRREPLPARRFSRLAVWLLRAAAALFLVGSLYHASYHAGRVALAQWELSTRFAQFAYAPVKVTPKAEPYIIAPDLSNVRHADEAPLPPAARRLLPRTGFAIVAREHPQMAQVFRANERDRIPHFITSDCVLHATNVELNRTLRQLEDRILIPQLNQLTDALLEESLRQYRRARGPKVRRAARRNVAFCAVAARLSGRPGEVPPAIEPAVRDEMTLIEEHDQIAVSPIFERPEDYTLYRPRGRYTTSERFRRYFRTMLWYGRAILRLRPGESPEQIARGRDETRSALLLVLALHRGRAGGRLALAVWQDLFTTLRFFFGSPDDLHVGDYHRQMVGDDLDDLYGLWVHPRDLEDDGKLDRFIARLRQLPRPRLLGAVSPRPDAAGAQGFALLGQRFSYDAYFLQQMATPHVRRADRERVLPSMLDVLTILRIPGTSDVISPARRLWAPDYARQAAGLSKRAGLLLLPGPLRLETDYGVAAFAAQALPAPPSAEHVPGFLKLRAWQRKQLLTVLASWTRLGEPPVARPPSPAAEGSPSSPVDGYVEPVPEFFNRLAARLNLIRIGLAEKFPPGSDAEPDILAQACERIGQLEQMANRLKTIAVKQLEARPLSKTEAQFLRDFPRDYAERLAAKPFEQDAAWSEMSAVTDVLTIGGGKKQQFLHLGIGPAREIYVVVPKDGQLLLARGPVYSYYEFVWPKRLTRGEWQTMEKPLAPRWTLPFVVRPGPAPEQEEGKR